MNDLIRKEKFKKGVDMVTRYGPALVLAPIAVWVTGSIIVLAACVAIVTVINALAPAFSQWVTNLKFKALGAVIDADPIQTAWTLYYKEGDELKATKTKLTQQAAALEELKLHLEANKRNSGRDPRPDQVKRLADMERIIAFRIAKFNQATEAHAEEGIELKNAEADYKFDKKSIEVAEAMDMGDSWQDKFTKDRVESALLATRAQSMAALRMSMETTTIDKIDPKILQASTDQPPVLEYDAQGHVLVNLQSVSEVRSAQQVRQ